MPTSRSAAASSPAAPRARISPAKERTMGRLLQTEGLNEFEQDILATVRDFTIREILPVATELEHRDEYPTQIVEGLKKLGLFGLTIPEAYGGLGASLLVYALAVEEIS